MTTMLTTWGSFAMRHTYAHRSGWGACSIDAGKRMRIDFPTLTESFSLLEGNRSRLHLVRTIATLAPFLTQPEQRQALAALADDAIETALNVLTLESDRAGVLNYYGQTYKALGRPSHQAHTARSAVPPTAQP